MVTLSEGLQLLTISFISAHVRPTKSSTGMYPLWTDRMPLSVSGAPAGKRAKSSIDADGEDLNLSATATALVDSHVSMSRMH